MDDDRQCTATSKQSGVRCKRLAIPGGRVCVMHGGATPAVRAAADRRRAEAQATALLELLWDPSAEPVTDPVPALQALAGRLQHAANVLGARLDTESLESATAVAWTRVLRELRQALEGMERLDLGKRQVELQQAQAEQVVGAVRVGLDALGSELLPVQRDVFLRAFLGALGRGPEVLASGEATA